MRDVYVGAMCAIGLFLFFYKGYDRWDDWAGNIAGFCAFCIAWFPTTKIGPQDLAGRIHFNAASIFFVILACFSLFLFTRKGENPTRQKLKRNKIYIACGVVMVVCLIAVRIYFSFLQEIYPASPFVFWNETAALVAFGISWLTKGGTLYPDKKH
jgi:magnesium-transporting ATPase (P-type)